MSQEINKQNSRFKQARFKSSREERIKSMRWTARTSWSDYTWLIHFSQSWTGAREKWFNYFYCKLIFLSLIIKSGLRYLVVFEKKTTKIALNVTHYTAILVSEPISEPRKNFPLTIESFFGRIVLNNQFNLYLHLILKIRNIMEIEPPV